MYRHIGKNSKRIVSQQTNVRSSAIVYAVKQIPQTVSVRIKALQKFLSRESSLVQSDGLFIQDPKSKDNDNMYVKIPWDVFTTHMLLQLSVEMHKEYDSAFIIGQGTYTDETGTLRSFTGCKFRDPEFAYMVGLNPETLTPIESPVDTVKAVPRRSSKER